MAGLKKKYTILCELGKGTFGTCYECTCKNDDDEIAYVVKRVRVEDCQISILSSGRMPRELQALLKLQSGKRRNFYFDRNFPLLFLVDWFYTVEKSEMQENTKKDLKRKCHVSPERYFLNLVFPKHGTCLGIYLKRSTVDGVDLFKQLLFG